MKYLTTNRYILPLLLIAFLMKVSAVAVDIEDKLMSTGFKTDRLNNGPIDTIVLHFSSNVKANKKQPYDVDAVIKIFAASNSSAHYLIGRDGKIYRLVKEKDTAYHAGKGEWLGRKDNLNQFSIGIELLGIGTQDEMKDVLTPAEYATIPNEHLGFTDAQYKSLKALLDDIIARHSIKRDRQHIIGHSEYAPGRKHDPGTLFGWQKIGL